MAKKKRYKLRLNRMSNWNYRLLTPDGLKEMLKLGYELWDGNQANLFTIYKEKGL